MIPVFFQKWIEEITKKKKTQHVQPIMLFNWMAACRRMKMDSYLSPS